MNEVRSELIALVPDKHHQPIIIKFVHETLKSGINSDTVKSAVLYTNAHSKGNTKQYRSYLGKTLENPNWHAGYLELVELENQQKQEVENVKAIKVVQDNQAQLLKVQQERERIMKAEQESEEFENFMKNVDVEAFDRFIETQCWDNVNNVMRRLWKEKSRYSTRRFNMKNFIAAQNGTAIVAAPALPATAQASVPLPAIAKPLESPLLPLQVQRPKSCLTSLSFIMPELMQGIRPQPTA